MMLRTIFLAALAIAAPAPQPDKHFKVLLPDRPLFVRASGNVDGSTFLRNLNDTLKKYHSKTFVPTYTDQELQKRISEEALVDQYAAPSDLLYYGPINVGSVGPQQFLVDFDTGEKDSYE